MSKKRSDALTALVHELADADREIVTERQREEEAQQEFTAARQVLDNALARTKAAVGRRTITHDALKLIQARDNVADELRYLFAAMVRICVASFSNRRGQPYHERKRLVYELRGCLDVYDREARS